MHKWKIRWYHSEQYKTSSYFGGQVLFDTADTYLLLLQVFWCIASHENSVSYIDFKGKVRVSFI